VEKKDRKGLFETLHVAEGTTFLLSVGRLVHEKAYEVLIQAMKIVVAEYPAVFLGIAGDGILRDRLQALIDRLDLGGNVCLLGDRKDVPALMANADVFIMSSRSEGMPVALLEAMGSGLPVVATRIGGLPEVIAGPSYGILVPPESPGDLAAAILQLVRNPGLCASMGQAARQRIKEIYTIESMCLRYESVMKSYYSRKRSQ
jgi:glycosyltransferase involved in cell wall biosynthesis